MPSTADWKWADLVILVKRAGVQFAQDAHKHKVPIVWDAVDFWPQPQNHFKEADARALLQRTIATIKPTLVIGATQAMAEAAGGVYLPHHGWKSLQPTPAREQIATVAYDGSQQYLGRWQRVLQDACKARGWQFVINPPNLSAVDLLIAVRDAQWDGWMCRQWKSGVKLVNGILAGRPVIRQHSAASVELHCPGTEVETHADLLTVLDAWRDRGPRDEVVRQCEALAPQYQLPVIAAQYQQILQAVVQREAVA